MIGRRYWRIRHGRQGGSKLVWVLVIGGLVVLALVVIAVVVAGDGYWNLGVTQPTVSVTASSSVSSDTEAARAAMMQYGDAAERENYPFRVDDVQVRGNRAIGKRTPLKRDGSVDPERHNWFVFVAQKVNGRWSVYTLSDGIIRPWVEPIELIYSYP